MLANFIWSILIGVITDTRLFGIILVASSRPPIPTSIKTTSHCSSLKYKCCRRFHFKRCRVRSHFVRNFTDTAYIISISVLTHIFCIYTKLFKINQTDGETYRPTFLLDSIKICSAKAPTLPLPLVPADVNNLKFILRITEFIAEI